MKKKIIIAVLVVIILGVGGYFLFQFLSDKNNASEKENLKTEEILSQENEQNEELTEEEKENQEPEKNKEKSIIGKSVEGRDIFAYHYGSGDTEILFIGGIHGGYSWNTSLVAYEAIDYFKVNSNIIPANLKITIIPVLNPDGLYKVVGTTEKFSSVNVASSQVVQVSGRFNANEVDLNRNFDCDWQSSAKWQDKIVSGGDSVFSEPESLAVKNYIETQKPKAVIVWYSAAGGVFSSSCHNGVLPETEIITQKFADASGYPAYKSFDFYATTGDMVNWLAKINIPAISVLLSNHTDIEWEKNKAGIEALLEYYTE
ncbi:hypothetical protein JW698_03020 [Candidatus Wolfebacteria bacterium]|nr:hypothetical protein [Candidatus Wolfebacteria bacterium]